MAFFGALVLALVFVAVLVWPLIRRDQTFQRRSSVLDMLEKSLWREQQVFDEIKILISDYDLGNTPLLEYQKKLEDHRFRAAYALKEREKLQDVFKQLENEVEDAVLGLRTSKGAIKEIVQCDGCKGHLDTESLLCPRCGLHRKGSLSSEEGVSCAK